jgi:phosphoribosylamine---glycine ligase
MSDGGPGRIMIVGGGGREHALAWKLAAEPGVDVVIVAPGSAGIAELPNVSIRPAVRATDVRGVVDLARAEAVDLVVVGPEAPLAAGLADGLADVGVAVFGPTRAAAAIESSKAFCHEVAEASGVPMAAARLCRSRAEADRAVRDLAARGTGVVLKEDGLAAGKGVTVLDHGQDPGPALDDLYGPAPDRLVLVEERLHGPEASVIALCDGERAIALPTARDHKRLRDDDDGPNTGGMGAYSPIPDLDDAAVAAIIDRVHRPILAEMARRGMPFRGFLYAGLMLTEDGPFVLECNARLGDPEAQVILPLVDADLGPFLRAASDGRLGDCADRVATRSGAALGIVLAGETYPVSPSQGVRIDGVEDARSMGALVFHAGTHQTGDGWETHGGRILTVVGRGADLSEARAIADRAADAVRFEGAQRRHDIGRTTVGSLIR